MGKQNGCRVVGRNKEKGALYQSLGHQIRVKKRTLALILKSNGPIYAKDWAKKNGATDILIELTKNKSGFGGPSKISQLAREALK